MNEQERLDDISKFGEKTSLLSSIIRYNTQFRLNDESVAEHSFQCAMIALKLYDSYKKDIPSLNREKLLIMSLIHDLGESQVGDISYDTKRKSKIIKQELDRLELDVVKSILPPDLVVIYEEFEKRESAESYLAKMTDHISALVYMLNEEQMGNKRIEERIRRCYHDINELQTKLKSFYVY